MTDTSNKSKQLILAGVSLLISLSLAELTVRLFLSDLVSTDVLAARLDRTSIRSLIRPSEDAELYYELRPNLKREFQGSKVFTDETGRRFSGEGVASERKAAIRVALIGDSSAFGYRVDYEDTYADQFRRSIESLTGVPVDLRNYSVPGYNASQEYRVFTQKVLAFDPQLLILHHDHNDSQETGWGYPPNFISPTYGDNMLGSSLLKLVIRQGKALLNRAGKFRDEDAHEYMDGYIIRGPLYETHLAKRRLLVDDTERLGIPTIAVIFSALVEIDPDYEHSERYLVLHERLAKKLGGMGYHVLDLYPLYQAELAARGWSGLHRWWVATEPLDAHPNPKGHLFIAEALVEYIQATPELARVFEPIHPHNSGWTRD